MTYRGLDGTYTIQTNVPLLGNVQATVPTELIVEEAYQAGKQSFYKDLPFVALGAFGIVVAGVVVGNLILGDS